MGIYFYPFNEIEIFEWKAYGGIILTVSYKYELIRSYAEGFSLNVRIETGTVPTWGRVDYNKDFFRKTISIAIAD